MTRRTTRHATRGERGFLLVEVLIAVVVFAIGALTLAAVMPVGMHSSHASGQKSRASELAAKKAEQLLNTPYNDPTLAANEHADPANPVLGDYFVLWGVEVNQPIASCKRVTITVSRLSANAPPLARVIVVKPEAG